MLVSSWKLFLDHYNILINSKYYVQLVLVLLKDINCVSLLVHGVLVLLLILLFQKLSFDAV